MMECLEKLEKWKHQTDRILDFEQGINYNAGCTEWKELFHMFLKYSEIL